MADDNLFIGTFGSNGGGKGVQGTQGTQGTQGAQGSLGIQGAQGFRGFAGLQGVQGVQGAIGTQGVQGISGAGTQGTQGVQGIINSWSLYPHKLASGSRITNVYVGGATNTATANDVSNFSLSPIVFTNGFVCNEIVFATLSSISTNVKLLIYSHSYTTGFADTLLYSSASIDITASNANFIVSLNFTFQAGVIYWIGFIRDQITVGNALLRGYRVGNILYSMVTGTTTLSDGIYANNINFASPPNPIDPATILYSDTAVYRCFAFNFQILSNL